MSDEKDKENYPHFLKGLGGVFVLILGITMVLIWWADVVSLFKGFLGMAVALAGMLVLYSLKK